MRLTNHFIFLMRVEGFVGGRLSHVGSSEYVNLSVNEVRLLGGIQPKSVQVYDSV